MAEDLRRVKTGLKVAANLERMGDLAANIAKRSLVIETPHQVPQREALRRLGNAVYGMTTDVLNAYRDGDAALAQRVWRQDESIDEMYNAIFLAILADMIADPRVISPGTHIHFVAKNIERIGDHATNIAEMVTYMMEDPRNITPCAHLLFVAKNIERIGDHATNIAETVYFQEKGTRLEGLRPKGDRTSYAVVEPPEPDAVT